MARGRNRVNPSEFGVDMEVDDFTDRLVEEFNREYADPWTIDELLLHPREAIRFCEELRHRQKWYYVPDDIILRLILNRRKNPTG